MDLQLRDETYRQVVVLGRVPSAREVAAATGHTEARVREHVRRGLGGGPPGATIPVTLLSALAHAWWGDRLSPDWQPRTREQNQAVLDRLGLTGPFWRLGSATRGTGSRTLRHLAAFPQVTGLRMHVRPQGVRNRDRANRSWQPCTAKVDDNT